MSIIAVTGASGFFGRALEPLLSEHGRLRGLFRTPSAVTAHWRERGHEVVFGDLSDPPALGSLLDGAEVVYHLAARMQKDDPRESHRVNVEGTDHLARTAHRAGVGRLLYVSSISVFAATDTGGRPVTEETEPERIESLNPYSATKYGGEEIVRSLRERGEGPDYTIVRPTNVYGPWGNSWFLDWVRRLRKIPVVPGGDIEVDLVHVDDVARALVQAAGSDAALGETIHIGHESLTISEYAVRVGRVVGLKVRRLPRPVDHLVRAVREYGHRLVKGTRMSMSLTRPVRYPHSKAARLIRYAPKVTLDEGLEATGRWYRERYAAEGLSGGDPPHA